jgi:hypothetical protein
MIGKLLSATGEAVYTATETASLLVLRSKEIEEARKKLEVNIKCHHINATATTKKDGREEVMMLRIKNSYSTDNGADDDEEEGETETA